MFVRHAANLQVVKDRLWPWIREQVPHDPQVAARRGRSGRPWGVLGRTVSLAANLPGSEPLALLDRSSLRPIGRAHGRHAGVGPRLLASSPSPGAHGVDAHAGQFHSPDAGMPHSVWRISSP